MFGHYDSYIYTFLIGVLFGGYGWHRAIKSYMHSLGRAMPFRNDHPTPQFSVPGAR